MKERPILFSAPMVRALLDGSKTQTRRVCKPAEAAGLSYVVGINDPRDFGQRPLEVPGSGWFGDEEGDVQFYSPYGRPGERLWVRETWGVVSNAWDDDGNLVEWVPDRPATAINEMRFGSGYYSGHAIYAADGSHEWAGDDDGGGEPRSAWHPSIHMPRAASRILLEIVSVRVERLQDISEADAMAEGAQPVLVPPDGGSCPHVEGYRDLWEQINGTGSWAANPWVWVVEFRQVERIGGKGGK